MISSSRMLSGIGAKGVVHSLASIGTLDIKAEKKSKEYDICEKTGYIFSPRVIVDKHKRKHIVSWDLMSS